MIILASLPSIDYAVLSSSLMTLLAMLVIGRVVHLLMKNMDGLKEVFEQRSDYEEKIYKKLESIEDKVDLLEKGQIRLHDQISDIQKHNRLQDERLLRAEMRLTNIELQIPKLTGDGAKKEEFKLLGWQEKTYGEETNDR
jgi:hypothetical protein